MVSTDPSIDIFRLVYGYFPQILNRHRSIDQMMINITSAIPRWFEQQVCRTPDRPAVKTRQHAVTYMALNEMANRIAWAILAQRGTGEETVAFLLDKDVTFVAAFLGILKAGEIAVPLDPQYPPARTGFMLEDSQATLLITSARHSALAASLISHGQHMLVVDDLATTHSLENPELALTPDTSASLLYTSGSTGQPKGVLQNHRNILHNVINHSHQLHITADDRLSLILPGGTIGSRRDLLSALLTGATLCLYTLAEDGLAPLATWLVQEEITIVNLVATAFRHFVHTLADTVQFPRVRAIKLGSETISPQDVALYRRHFPSTCRLHVGFGSTETENVTRYVMDHHTPLPGDLVPAGYNLDGMEVRICDETGAPVPNGEVGEIVVRSCYLALGYWRRPDLTAAVFLPDPEGGDARLYRTGDLGRLRHDGCLEHLGRSDAQVKIRGHRVELTEIELALLSLPGIKQAAVVAHEPMPGDTRLVAYAVPTQPPGPSREELRSTLRERFPAHMVPAVFVVLDALPTTPQGKVDRRALPEPNWQALDPSRSIIPPRTPIEAELVRLWSEVLGLEQVGIDEPFLDLGGHSLLAAQVIAGVSATWQVDVPIQALLTSSTVAQMALVITERLADHLAPDGLNSLLQEIEGSDGDGRVKERTLHE
jgi:amino acid adenylation domain-containing protein